MERSGAQGEASQLADREAALRELGALYERLSDRIHRFLRALTGDGEMAGELTQETFLRLHRARGATGSEGPSDSYVFAIARNAALSRLRRRRWERSRFERLPLDADAGPPVLSSEPDPLRRLEQRELRDALLAALAELSEEQRSVFLLSELEGLSYDEIASVLGCRAGTVGSRKHKAVRKLRRKLGRIDLAL